MLAEIVETRAGKVRFEGDSRPRRLKRRVADLAGKAIPLRRLERRRTSLERRSGKNARRGATLRVEAGFRLGYAEYGDPDGFPILFFHGIPGSRLLGRTLHDHALACGGRIVALERPGYGLSDYRSAPSVARCARLVRSVAESLGLERVCVLGVSGGGPYALACGRLFPQRIEAIGVVSGIGTAETPGVLRLSSRLLVALGRISPLLAAPPLALARRRADHRLDGVLAELETQLLAEGVDHPWAARLILADLLEAFSSGCRGVAADCARVSRWGFEPEDVRVPVHLWHGCDDGNISVAAAQGLARRLPDCHAHFLPGEGHFGVLPHHAEEIVGTLVAGA